MTHFHNESHSPYPSTNSLQMKKAASLGEEDERSQAETKENGPTLTLHSALF